MMLSTLLILAVYRTRVVYELRELPIVESLWLSGRASQHGIRRSEFRFLMGTQNFFFVPRLWQDEKHLSQAIRIFALLQVKGFFNISCIWERGYRASKPSVLNCDPYLSRWRVETNSGNLIRSESRECGHLCTTVI